MTEKVYYTKEEWKALSIETRHAVEKKQLFDHLEEVGPDVVFKFLERVNEGKIYGNDYWDEDSECGCVLGTLKYYASQEDADEAMITGTDNWGSSWAFSSPFEGALEDPSLSVVEVLAYNLRPGDTPENNENARLLRDWTQEWLDNHRVAN